MTYLKEIQDAFLKLEEHNLGWAKSWDDDNSYAKELGYLSITQQDGNIKIVLDGKNLRDFEPGELEPIAESLKAAKIEDVNFQNQFVKYKYAAHDYNKDGSLHTGAVPTGTEETLYEQNPNPENVSVNPTAKLELTVPDTMDSVLKLNAAFRHNIAAKAKAQLTAGIERAEAISSSLGEKEAKLVMQEIYKDLGVNQGQTR